MNKIKKEDIKQEVFDLYDDYAAIPSLLPVCNRAILVRERVPAVANEPPQLFPPLPLRNPLRPLRLNQVWRAFAAR